MNTKNNTEKEKIAYEQYMESQGYQKLNEEWVLIKYPPKDPKNYKKVLPKKP
jgi:hypothetical protein